MPVTPKKLIFLLSPLVVALAFAMDIYVPALPNIATLFHVSAGKMQLTLTFFMLTAGVMQLVVGPLSDHFGRKPIAYWMILVFSLGTIFCSFAHDLTALIFYRIIQAIGACGMMVIAFAIVRDLYAGEKGARIYSFLNGIIAFSPMFAPFIGSYLDVHFDWSSTFLALLVLSALALLATSIGLKETAHLTRDTSSASLWQRYHEIAKHPVFIMYTIVTAIGLSYLYLFCSISPYIIIRLLHIPELDYGFYFCFMGISFFIGSFLSATLVTIIGIYRTVLLGFLITLIGGFWMSAWYFWWGLSIHGFVWPMLLVGIGGTLCMGAGAGGAMHVISKNIGAASALSGAFRFLFAAILGTFLIIGNIHSTLPLALPAVGFSIAGLIIFYWRRDMLFNV